MADTYYSNHYSGAIGATGHFGTLQTPIVDRVPSGFGGSRLRHKFCHYIVPATTNFGDNDEIRLFDVKSGDRPINLFVSMNDQNGATATWNYGLWFKGDDNDGAVINEDVFAAAHNEAAAIARVDVLTLGGLVADWDVGKTFWEHAAASVDPRVMYTVGKQASADPTVVDGAVETLVELIYIAGD